jgi:outer membrane protein
MMKRKVLVLMALCAMGNAFAQNAPTGPLVTIQECYNLAVKQSETIAITDEFINQAEAQYGQAKGGALPEIFFGYDSAWQDRPASTGTTPGALFITPTTNTRLGVRKSLFSGYREIAAIKSGSNFVDQRREEKKRALQLLLNDVANAFYGTLQAEADLAVTKKNHELLQQRLKETQSRVRVGRNRAADVAALESQVATLEAQALETQRLVDTQRELLSFLTGQKITGQLEALDINIGGTSLNEYVARVGNRPDVQAQEMAIDVATAAVRLERSKHFPTLDMGANYYLDRRGFREDVDWDATINLEIPIWAWGSTQKGVNAAKTVVNQQRLLARETRRRAEMDIQNAYRDAISARQQRKIYETASKAAQKEHNLTEKDYRSGLVSTFDVLNTMIRLYETERGYNLAVLRYRLAEVNLKITSGYTPEEILQ